jgi:hypothetical protein
MRAMPKPAHSERSGRFFQDVLGRGKLLRINSWGCLKVEMEKEWKYKIKVRMRKWADAWRSDQGMNRERLEKARPGPANASIDAFTRLEAIG